MSSSMFTSLQVHPITVSVVSVTGCQNKKLPKNYQNFPKVATADFTKRGYFTRRPKSHQIFGLVFKQTLSPRTFKNLPILSHCLWFESRISYQGTGERAYKCTHIFKNSPTKNTIFSGLVSYPALRLIHTRRSCLRIPQWTVSTQR